jgi:hypothetical protein
MFAPAINSMIHQEKEESHVKEQREYYQHPEYRHKEFDLNSDAAQANARAGWRQRPWRRPGLTRVPSLMRFSRTMSISILGQKQLLASGKLKWK